MKKPDKHTDYKSLVDPAPASAPSTVPPSASLPHRRQGDRGSPDDAATLPIFLLRYSDLVAAHIVENRATLARLIEKDGFPPGFMLGRNTRAWALADVEAWIASRPVARKEVPRIVAAVAGRAAARAKAKAETAEQQQA